jgi:mercuric ion binding protein
VTKLVVLIALGLGSQLASAALAADRTITLGVQNMDCAACPFVVRRSLQAVPGVASVSVSYEDKTAIVTYDDSKADLKALTAATTDAGYPSAPKR